MKQHIAHVKGNVAPCQKSTKDDQLRCRDAINEGKLKKKGKQAHDEALRSEVRFDTNENISIDTDEIENNFGSLREPYVIGPMDNFANRLNPEESLKSGKGKKVDINNAIRKERISTVKSFIDGVGIVGDGQGTDELGQSSRTRELLDEDFASGSEEEVFEEVDYESDGVHIMEECGDKE
ncbi:unnamed protein product [Lactuca saligna]|uniref:Uncharacterized protein n=1 Tax=Lactuca saligna TaxID=75948 RepID=A0AA36E851_LACSI|nr:unnamed protein product [Lactuca saligna]